MSERRMQAKDIPDEPILRLLETRNGEWTLWWDITKAMPEGVPEKVVLAKMASLIRRGLVDGCACGCRGDFVLTEKGKATLTGDRNDG